MSKYWEFCKYYIRGSLKTWWPIVFFIIPHIKEWILKNISFYKPEMFTSTKLILDKFDPWWVWIAIFFILLAHIKIIYELWDFANNKKQYSLESMDPSYEFILNKVNKYIPDKYPEFKKVFRLGYESLKRDSLDIKTAIQAHYNAYKIIYDFLKKYFTSDKEFVQVSIELVQIREKFEQNFLKLKEYNGTLGINNNIPNSEYKISELIDNINNNLKSFFAEFGL